MKCRLLIAALLCLLFLTGCNDTSHDAIVYMGESSLTVDNVHIDTTGEETGGI